MPYQNSSYEAYVCHTEHKCDEDCENLCEGCGNSVCIEEESVTVVEGMAFCEACETKHQKETNEVQIKIK